MWTEGRDRSREGASGQRAAPGDTPAGGRPAVGWRPNLLPHPVTRPRRQHAGLSAVGLGPGGEEGRVPRGRPSTACRGELGRGRGAAGSTMERARQAARRPLQNPEPGRPPAAPAAEVRGDAERGQVGRERRPRGQPRREGGGGASGGRARLMRQAPPPPRPWGRATGKALSAEASPSAPFAPRSPVSPSAGSTGDSRAPRPPTATPPHSKAPSGPHGARGPGGCGASSQGDTPHKNRRAWSRPRGSPKPARLDVTIRVSSEGSQLIAICLCLVVSERRCRMRRPGPCASAAGRGAGLSGAPGSSAGGRPAGTESPAARAGGGAHPAS